MDNMIEVLYNGIASEQAPGLNAYEKSVFLTKAQNEVVLNHFNAKSKGNTLQEGYDDNPKRQVDFSMLTSVATTTAVSYLYLPVVPEQKDEDGNVLYVRTEKPNQEPYYSYTQAYNGSTPMKDANGNPLYIRNEGIDVSGFEDPLFDMRDNSKSITLPSKMMIPINEMVEVVREGKTVTLQVIPMRFDTYSRLMSKPFKRPLKYQAWRLINNSTVNKADIIVGPSDTLSKYIIRYIRRPNPIIVSDLDGLTIEGKENRTECELDPILHEEIVQRAVELAKITWDATAANGSTLAMQAGQRSE